MIEGALLFTMRNLGRSLVRELGVVDNASPCNISLAQCHVLVELEKDENLTAQELAERLIVDKSAISRTLSQLSEAGLIYIKDDAEDRRRKKLSLTKLGLKKVAEIHQTANLRVEDALSLLEAGERQTVVKGLATYVKALNWARLQKAYTLRNATKADRHELIRLTRGILIEFDVSTENIDALLPDDFLKPFQTPQAKFFVVEKNGSLVGGGGICCFDAKQRICELKHMYFLAEARGLGLGRLLLQRCLGEAKELGYKRCYLETKSNMVHAQKLYSRFGFTRLPKPFSGTVKGCDLYFARDL